MQYGMTKKRINPIFVLRQIHTMCNKFTNMYVSDCGRDSLEKTSSEPASGIIISYDYYFIKIAKIHMRCTRWCNGKVLKSIC
jgi:hypothetical protein